MTYDKEQSTYRTYEYDKGTEYVQRYEYKFCFGHRLDYRYPSNTDYSHGPPDVRQRKRKRENDEKMRRPMHRKITRGNTVRTSTRVLVRINRRTAKGVAHSYDLYSNKHVPENTTRYQVPGTKDLVMFESRAIRK